MGNGEWGLRIADCGLKKISIAVSQPAVPVSRFGINIPHSALRIPYSPLSALPPLSSVAFTRAAASNKAFILAENW
jgi:hypothetical protein